MASYEYNECIALSVALGKTREQAQKDWQDVNSMTPVWCEIIKNYPCTCDGLSQLHTEVKNPESESETGTGKGDI